LIGEEKFCRKTTASGSTDFAETVEKILRTRAMMSSVSAGMPKYTAAGVVGCRA
jgi:hypothetical protein